MNYIDLFAGAGGLSEGFIQAGYAPVAHVEMNEDASNTLRTRACYHWLKANDRLAEYYAYELGEISRDDLYALVPEVELDRVINETISEESIDGIFERIDALLHANRDWNGTVWEFCDARKGVLR